MPKLETWTSYIHRVGRTGRVGNTGCATTFFSPTADRGMALILYRVTISTTIFQMFTFRKPLFILFLVIMISVIVTYYYCYNCNYHY
ncbi:unnamed protein product [Gongylonema pulchrum]|uniref:Helicase C-terminal domain-containing protein n=1 Tax=Gongylonema pulchrum TaxID=637853 RepID=A0A183F1C6_9BILA|nr:unnamed protein product [Gongylonema pulchrum]